VVSPFRCQNDWTISRLLLLLLPPRRRAELLLLLLIRVTPNAIDHEPTRLAQSKDLILVFDSFSPSRRRRNNLLMRDRAYRPWQHALHPQVTGLIFLVVLLRNIWRVAPRFASQRPAQPCSIERCRSFLSRSSVVGDMPLVARHCSYDHCASSD
jgi:hypothetical protein